MTKAECRVLYKQQRAALSAEELVYRNKAIDDRLMEYNWQEITYLHTYVPMGHMKEPDIWPFVRYFAAADEEHYVVVSRTNPKDCTMQHVLLSDETQLKENAWGIAEPVEGELIDEKFLDAVLVPLLACDAKGNRIGYGKGFYDRFLANCRVDCRKIGISFFEPLDEVIEDASVWDIPLDAVIFPEGIQYYKL